MEKIRDMILQQISIFLYGVLILVCGWFRWMDSYARLMYMYMIPYVLLFIGVFFIAYAIIVSILNYREYLYAKKDKPVKVVSVRKIEDEKVGYIAA